MVLCPANLTAVLKLFRYVSNDFVCRYIMVYLRCIPIHIISICCKCFSLSGIEFGDIWRDLEITIDDAKWKTNISPIKQDICGRQDRVAVCAFFTKSDIDQVNVNNHGCSTCMHMWVLLRGFQFQSVLLRKPGLLFRNRCTRARGDTWGFLGATVNPWNFRIFFLKCRETIHVFSYITINFHDYCSETLQLAG